MHCAYRGVDWSAWWQDTVRGGYTEFDRERHDGSLRSYGPEALLAYSFLGARVLSSYPRGVRHCAAAATEQSLWMLDIDAEPGTTFLVSHRYDDDQLFADIQPDLSGGPDVALPLGHPLGDLYLYNGYTARHGPMQPWEVLQDFSNPDFPGILVAAWRAARQST